LGTAHGTTSPASSAASSGVPREEEKEAEAVGLMWRMLTAVHVHGMRHLTYGWRHLERTLTFLRVRAKSEKGAAPEVRTEPQCLTQASTIGVVVAPPG